MSEHLIWNIGIVAGMTVLLWLVSVAKKDASIIDPFWSVGFLLIAWNTFRWGAQHPAQLLLGVIVTLWALRLSIYLGLRNHGLPEDPRYQAFRRQFGAERYWWVSFFQVFLLQGLLMLIISWPLQAAMRDETVSGFEPWHWIGAAVALAGLIIETLADRQLATFRGDPGQRGQVLDSGLWKYSRHPNYFGEAVIWWGFWMFSLASPGGVQTVFAPLLMTILLLRVSGVTLLEKTLKKTKPGYQQYVERTSAFVLWPPKK